jgi:hypothetical protein
MADSLEIGHIQDTSSGKDLNTGSMRRSYSSIKNLEFVIINI